MSLNPLRAQLIGLRSSITPVPLPNNVTAYLRATTVGAVNFDINMSLAHMVQLCEKQGIAVDLEQWDDPDKLKAWLRRRVGDPYELARRLAIRLCDEAGELVFDADNEDDLKLINSLDGAVLAILRAELDRVTPVKNPQPGDASSSS